MKIIVDAMGGDNAPFEIVKGAVQAASILDAEIQKSLECMQIPERKR